MFFFFFTRRNVRVFQSRCEVLENERNFWQKLKPANFYMITTFYYQLSNMLIYIPTIFTYMMIYIPTIFTYMMIYISPRHIYIYDDLYPCQVLTHLEYFYGLFCGQDITSIFAYQTSLNCFCYEGVT